MDACVYPPEMAEPVSMLLLEIEAELSRVPGAKLVKATRSATELNRLQASLGRNIPAGYAAFVSRYDGGWLLPSSPAAPPNTDPASVKAPARATDIGLRLLSLREGFAVLEDPARATELKGLWPIAERGSHLLALDCESTGESEFPVVEVVGRNLDRVGSSFLRFIYAWLGELLAGEGADPTTLAAELCRRDPGLAEHWVHLVDHLEILGRGSEADEVLAEALRCASPPGPGLMTAVALRALDVGDNVRALAALDDALDLEALTARDDDARLDAAAISLVLASERGDGESVARAKEFLGTATASTGAFWRGEAVANFAIGNPTRARLAGKIVEALVPGDNDVVRMRESHPHLQEALRALAKARDLMDAGTFAEAVQQVRVAINLRPDLGLCHLMLAEGLSACRERGALDAARRATELNPALIDAWREMGDCYLESRQAARAEEAYREAIARDNSYAPGFAKLAQALLEQGRTREALEAVTAAQERGGDSFFVAAIRGDILAEMERHNEAAEAYDQATHLEPEDHWVLHQAAREHCRAGHDERAAELFERALRFDRDGCHQTLVDYGDLLRRVGRIGDAVRMYRRAVAACPQDVEWRRVLREAERELMSAPS
jgi:tetratricopeptide (TPR) repeat protein